MGRQGIDGLPDTYNPLTGTGARVAQNEKEAAQIYSQLPKGSRAEQQRLSAEAGGGGSKKDRKGRA